MSYRKINNKKGQMLIIEVIIFSIMILSTLLFITQLSPPPLSSTDISSNKLKILSDDTLRTIDSMPISDAYERYTSPIGQCIALNDRTTFSNYVEYTLLGNKYQGYNIYVGNGIEKRIWIDKTENFGKPYGEIARSQRLVVIYPETIDPDSWANQRIIQGYDGCVYNVIMEIW